MRFARGRRHAVQAALMGLALLAASVAQIHAGHLRQAARVPTEQPAGSESAVAPDSVDGGALATTLTALADKIEKSEGKLDPQHQAYADAVVHSIKVLGRHHATKVTLQQIADAVKGLKAEKEKPKIPLGKILDALRLPEKAAEPPKPKLDPKKVLSSVVNKVEGKLQDLEEMLDEEDKKAEAGASAAEAPVTNEEEMSHDMQTGLDDVTPEGQLPAPIAPVPPPKPLPFCPPPHKC